VNRVIVTYVCLAVLSWTLSTGVEGADITLLQGFSGTSGTLPEGNLAMDGEGNIYGCTNGGGLNGDGTLYRLDAVTHDFSIVANFSEPVGISPDSLVFDSHGNLFGSTLAGNTNLRGTIFEITAGDSTPVMIANIPTSYGGQPVGKLSVDSDGNLFGTIANVGLSTYGNIFEVSAGTHTLSTLYTFGSPTRIDSANGSHPTGGLTIDQNGNLYGATSAGGANHVGTLFEIDGITHALTTITSIDNSVSGYIGSGITLDASGMLYGSTYQGGLAAVYGTSAIGTIFQFDRTTNTFKILQSFEGPNGSNPVNFGGLIFDAAGDLFGTTSTGGDFNCGTVFEISAATGICTTIYNFDGSDGFSPVSGLVADSAGNLYGTATGEFLLNGSFNYGELFELTNTGFVVAVPESSSVSTLLVGISLIAMCRLRLKKDV
jgi:uncharacterized repeat protein (TIGR03803 family)